MRLNMRVLILVLVTYMLCSISTYASDYDISDIKLNNIVVPKDFGVCTIDGCDDEFRSLLKTYDHTYEDWVEKIMKPDNIYFYASNKDEQNIYIQSVDLSGAVDTSEFGSVYEYDFNLAKDEKKRNLILDEHRRTLINEGVNDGNIEMTFVPADEKLPTCYITSKYRDGNLYVYEYHTIYAGRAWTFCMSSTRGMNDVNYRILDNLISNLEYDYDVDYSDLEMAIKQKAEEEDEAAKYSISKDGRVIFLVTTITIVFLIIYIITEKQRKKF